MSRFCLWIGCLLWGVTVALANAYAEGENGLESKRMLFKVIHKVTGRSEKLKLAPGSFSSFDKLQIYPARCERIEQAGRESYRALVEVYETSLSRAPAKLFSGWLFSDSHSLTNLEDQYYDLLLISCDADAPEKAPSGDTQTTLPTENTNDEAIPAD